jgi:hypothetical protein
MNLDSASHTALLTDIPGMPRGTLIDKVRWAVQTLCAKTGRSTFAWCDYSLAGVIAGYVIVDLLCPAAFETILDGFG